MKSLKPAQLPDRRGLATATITTQIHKRAQYTLRWFCSAVCWLLGGFFSYCFYDRYLRWRDCFNELGRCYDPTDQIVYTDAGFVWAMLAVPFLLLAIGLTFRLRRPSRKRRMEKFTPIIMFLLLTGTAGRADTAAPLPALARTVVASALAQTRVTTGYDPAYVALHYPGGDVAANTGVCADVIIRALRAANVDLQREVHRDMLANFSAYPKNWGLRQADANIDHRRVPNLMTYFRRQGKALPIGRPAQDYRAGDLVAWDLGSGLTHIGVVTDRIDGLSGRPLVVHNIGAGARLEDVLFSWPQIGHYRYFD